jgi:hypothetical protein
LSIPGVIYDGVQILCVWRQERPVGSTHVRLPRLSVAFVVSASYSSHATSHRCIQGHQVQLKQQRKINKK